jgi:predicted neuraminidase
MHPKPETSPPCVSEPWFFRSNRRKEIHFKRREVRGLLPRLATVLVLLVPCLASFVARTAVRAEQIAIERVLGPEHPGGHYKHPASLTELDNGDLLLSFYGGSGEYATDTAVYAIRRRQGSDTWTAPEVIADTPMVSEGNPVIWQAPDGWVWLFYVVRYGETWSTSRIQAKISRDGARTWSDPTVLAFEEGMMVRGHPLVLAGGDYLLPIYHETGHDPELVGAQSTSLFLRYDVRNRKWSESTRIGSKNGNIQPAVAALTDDHLVAYCRRGGGYGPETKGYIIRSESWDRGRTWSEGADTTWPNPNAAVDFLRLASGHFLLVYNHSMAERDPLTVAISIDQDRSYPFRVNLAEGESRDFAYPYAVQTKDKKIHVIFTSDQRTVIHHAVFEENAILDAPQLFTNVKDPKAVEEVRAGKRPAANAAWWGFDEQDATSALQGAIQSGATKVFVPNLGQDWIVRPITLAGNQELIFEEGVVISAKRGDDRSLTGSMFSGSNLSNLTVRGYGATIRMQKEDYLMNPRPAVGESAGGAQANRAGVQSRAERRAVLRLNGVAHGQVLGLTLREGGADGLLLTGEKGRPCRDIHLRDVICDNNSRQGLSALSVDGLNVEDCVFKNTWGIAPSAGVSLEPENADQILRNVVFRSCRFEDNQGQGIAVILEQMRRGSGDVSILFDRCYVTSRRGAGIQIGRIRDDGPAGLIEFRTCSVAGTDGPGLNLRDKAAAGARVRFVDCTVRDGARRRQSDQAWAPIVFDESKPGWTAKAGGIEFANCRVEDAHDRPAIVAQLAGALSDLAGVLTVRNPRGVKAALPASSEKDGLLVRADPVSKHVKVYGQPGRFGGWPANHGIWSWDNEILVGFSAGYHKDLGPTRHAIDRERPEEHLLARSRDGGETWTIEDPSAQGALIPTGPALHGVTPPGLKERPWQDCPGGINFQHPDFAMTLRMTDANGGPARFYYSTNRGQAWEGPFRLPLFGQQGVAARTDYVVTGPHECFLFLTAPKANGREGRPFCARTIDGGRSWEFLSWIGGEPEGYAIMPSTIRLGQREFLSAIRCREGDKSWIQTHRSTDSGRTWTLDGTPAPDTGEGNPPSMIRMADGRVCLTYGYRAAPFGLRARVSQDGGKTWTREIILRDDGGGRDVGYPRTVQRPGGKLVTVYYYHDTPDGNRYIAATIWNPPQT